jgi:aspartate aminotransferase
MPALADRLDRTKLAATVAMTIKARALRAAGHDVVALTIGEPDFATPRHAIEGAYQAALAGQTKYTPQDGTVALKQAVQRKFQRERGLAFDLDQISISNGGKQAIFNAFMATLNDGDEVVIPTPCWAAYGLMAQFVGGVPVFVPCPQNNGFKLRPEDLDAAITPKSKWLLLNNPCNPTGAACTREELEAIAAVMRRHPHVWLMADDMYEHMVYDGFEFVTLAQIAPDLRDRILTISGVSKTYAMTGWRVGFSAGPRDLIRAMVASQGHIAAGVSGIAQAAAVAALEGPQDIVAEMRETYRRRRDFCVDALNAMPGVSCHKPEGAFYLFPNIAGCLGKTTAAGRMLDTDADFAEALLEEKYVALVQGASFGMSPYLRISYATDDDSLHRAMARMAEFTGALA